MSSNNINGRAKAGVLGRRSNHLDDLEADTKLLRALLADSHQNPSDASELAELLAQLESADGVATGVESKLDEILDTLDNLLTSLEHKDEDNIKGDTSSTPEASSPGSQPESA